MEDLAPLSQRGIRRDSVVLAHDLRRGLVRLEPGAGLEGLVGLSEEGGPVGDAARHPAGVDVVEGGGGEGPFAGAVFNLAGDWRIS